MPSVTGPVVKTKDGLLRGKAAFTGEGTRYWSFQGIPYAKPPVGDLRFKVGTAVKYRQLPSFAVNTGTQIVRYWETRKRGAPNAKNRGEHVFREPMSTH